ncbi:YciI family protein [Saccharopolyspora sp. K220]|uniref:YciI family protein n=1 Tax=Saccharopolyspora soli TaxID=2926618 RepID=UPI001F5A6766|nr:YciI family protein [Saccharopolyspora soli]MCI2422334.1 YciI family protein [Saccharopolyspora soli]
MFVLLPTYQVPLDQVDAVLTEHRAWLDEQFASGRFLVAGRRVPREGGFILAADGDRAEIEQLAATDPFAIEGIAHYEVLEVQPTGGMPGVLAALAGYGVRIAGPNRDR